MTIPASDWAPQATSSFLNPVYRARDWLDERGKPAWLVAMVLGFILAWPVGLAILAYLIWSKRMFCSKRSEGRSARSSYGSFPQSSGNSAFDAYREETLKRLEDEHRQFRDFLQHLREAKDKAEFDEFMRTRQDVSRDVSPVTGDVTGRTGL